LTTHSSHDDHSLQLAQRLAQPLIEISLIVRTSSMMSQQSFPSA